MNYPIHIEKVSQSRINEVDFDNIPFGKYYGDHMFMADYNDGKWGNCRIVPYGNLSLSPATTFIHYGQSIFEGMKAYKAPDGSPQIFRPGKNFDRLNLSAKRMAMPELPNEIFMEGLHQLIDLDQQWIPARKNCSLYIRPYMFATDEYIGIKPTNQFRFIIITSPAGAYYTKPVKVLVSDKYVRAFHGGTGFAKAAGNYAATMLPMRQAREKGYDQVLWLDGKEFKYVQEIGTMNIFFIIAGVIVTPKIEDTLLDGITRDSVIQLLKDKGASVEERLVTIDEIYEAYKKGTLEGSFGTGTAATIAPVATYNYKGEDLNLPQLSDDSIIYQVKNELEAIKTSKTADKHGWIVKIKSYSQAEKVI